MPDHDPTSSQSLASHALAAELKKKVRESGMVVWLDADKRFVGLVEDLAAGGHDFPYPVVAFRGSYLELMLALEPYGSGLDPDHLLIHLPGLNKTTVRQTPVYELYAASTVFEKGLAAVVREAAIGVARPEEVDAFLRSGDGTLEAADAWLAELRAVPRDRLTLLVESLGVEDVAVSLATDDGRFAEHLPHGGKALLAFLERGLGLSEAFRSFRIRDKGLTRTAMATLVASWVMAVEFANDLKSPPVMPVLQPLVKLGPFEKLCRGIATRLRETAPAAYETAAFELEEVLTGDRTHHHARDLGAIDTLRFEETTIRAATLAALVAGTWDDAASFAGARTAEQCFWVKRSTTLPRTWELLRLAAETGRAIHATKRALDRCGSLDEAVGRYAEKLAPVDRLHRMFEQRAHALIAVDLDDYEALLEVRRAVRRAYRDWADTTNRAFSHLCATQGPLPSRSLRQRAIFEEEVRPLLDQGGEAGRIAYVLVDALRFEMAQGLAAELKRDGVKVGLRSRLAELPTETAIGMNALAPVERNGRLRLVQKAGAPVGFRVGELTVAQPAHRVRAISQSALSDEAATIPLEAFADLDLLKLKRMLHGKPQLIVVHSRDLDTAGEHGLHLGTFEQTLSMLKSAMHLLSQAGVERFIVTADHGFLLQDTTTENVPFGATMRVPQRRYALLSEPSGMPDVLELQLSALEYDVEEDLYLVLRHDTALWQVKDRVAPFVHGGNSLQERVIPVLEIQRKAPRGRTLSKYEVVARPEAAHLGRQRLRVAVRLQDRQNLSLGFVTPPMITLALRVSGRPGDQPPIALTLLDAGPPAKLLDGRVQLAPGREEAVIEFELEGELDEKVRVEVYHPDGREEVAPKIVEGFFDVWRDRRRPRTPTSPPPGPPAAAGSRRAPSEPPPSSRRAAEPRPADPRWNDLIEDPKVRQVFELLADHQIVNEIDLGTILGSPRRVRVFARELDGLVQRIPFQVEIGMINGLKTYQRKD